MTRLTWQGAWIKKVCSTVRVDNEADDEVLIILVNDMDEDNDDAVHLKR